MSDFFSSVRYSSASNIKYFIETSVGNVNFQNEHGVSVLHFAALNAGNVEVVKVLVSMGANINAKANNGYTPLHVAVENDNAEVVKALVDMRADMNIRDTNSITPFEMAIYHGKVEIVKILLSHGANVNPKDPEVIIPPLHMAVVSKNTAGEKCIEIAKLLISKGADIHAKTDAGDTPLDLAMKATNDPAMFLCLLDNESVENIGQHIKKFFRDINFQGDNGWTILHQAVQEQYVNIVNALVSMGADVNIGEKKGGITPLDLAIGYGKVEILEILLPCVPDVNVKDKNNSTLLHRAVVSGKMSGGRNVEVAKLLITKGVDINAISVKGTALDLAKELGDTAMFQYLSGVMATKDKEEIDKIVALYESRLRDNPNDAKIYEGRGVMFMAHGLTKGDSNTFLDHAIADFTEAIRLDPQATNAYYCRAGLYSRKKDLDRTIADYNSMIRIDPNNTEAYAFRGNEYSQIGKYDQALTDFNEAIRINPKCTNAYTFRGSMYFEKGVQNKENSDYDKAVEDIERAIKDVEEALRIDPEDAAATYLIKNVRNEKEVIYRLRSERQEQYDRLVQEMNNASTEKKYKDLAQRLRTMQGYKDTAELANKCDNQYNELKKERKRREMEEYAKRVAVEKRKKLIGILAAVVAVAGLVVFIVYRQTGSFFKFQENGQGTFVIIGYSGVKQVVIPPTNKGINVTEIGDKAFLGKKLTSVIIPDGITYIGEDAFRGNQLTNVIISDSVTGIGKYAFFNNKLTEVSIGNGVTSIGDFAFSGNHNSNGDPTNDGNQLTNVSIPDSVTVIGQRAFRYNQLTSLSLGNHVEIIGNRAFSTNKLTSVTIPNSVKTIEEAAFISNQLTSIVIPNSVTTIAESTFSGNKLASVTIPTSVTSIERNAFRENQLTTVNIPNSVKTIGYASFYKNQLTSINIGNSITTIEDHAFNENKLTNVQIPNSVTSIGVLAFANNPVTSLRLGTNVKLGDEGNSGALGQNTGFNTAYANNGKRAGTYTRPNTDSTRWTRR